MSNELVSLLNELVALPSVNPSHTDQLEIANEFRVAEFMTEFLRERGFAIEMEGESEERYNVIASYGPATADTTVMLEAHLDTVGVTGMVIPPFEPAIRDGRLYGRGACDTKGPMAAGLLALTPPLLDALADAGIRLVFVGAYGEEKGNVGAERLVQQGFRADTAIILEPTEMAVVHAHKGALWYQIDLRGVAAHGSDPAKGKNAIVAMGEVVQWLTRRIEEEAAKYADSVLGPPTVNIGRIEGGLAMNIVAPRCVAEVDRRLVPGEDPESIMAAVEAHLETLKEADHIRGYALNPIKSGTPFSTPTDAAVVTDLSRALEQGGVPPRLTTAAWYSDAGAFARCCDEVVVFGPGSIEQAHTEDEYIECEELEQGRVVLSAYLERLAGHRQQRNGE